MRPAFEAFRNRTDSGDEKRHSLCEKIGQREITLVVFATLVAPLATLIPAAIALTPGLSAVAEEAINLNSSRSNKDLKTKTDSSVTTPKAGDNVDRMGGGGGARGGGARMGGGGGTSMGGGNVDRMGGGGGTNTK